MENISRTKLQPNLRQKVRFSDDSLVFGAVENDKLVLRCSQRQKALYIFVLTEKLFDFCFVRRPKRALIILQSSTLTSIDLGDFARIDRQIAAFDVAVLDGDSRLLYTSDGNRLSAFDLSTEVSTAIDVPKEFALAAASDRCVVCVWKECAWRSRLFVRGDVEAEFVFDGTIECADIRNGRAAVGLSGGATHVLSLSSPTRWNLHWHASSPTAVCLAPAAPRLYSGGKEGVLVAWDFMTQSKDFLPRLGAAITGISCSANGQYIGVTLSNAQLLIVHVESFRCTWQFKGINLPEMFLCNPQADFFGVSGRNGVIELCRPTNEGIETALIRLGECPPECHNQYFSSSYVALSADGCFMAAIEVLWEDPLPASRLRFFELDGLLNNKLVNPFAGGFPLGVYSGVDRVRGEQFFLTADNRCLRWWALRSDGADQKPRFEQAEVAALPELKPISPRGRGYTAGNCWLAGNYFIANDEGSVSCFDISTRRPRLCFRCYIKMPIESITLIDGLLAIAESNVLYLLEPESGNTVRQFSFKVDIWLTPLSENRSVLLFMHTEKSDILLLKGFAVERVWSVSGRARFAWIGADGKFIFGTESDDLYCGETAVETPNGDWPIDEIGEKVRFVESELRKTKVSAERLRQSFVFAEQSALLPPIETTFNRLFEVLFEGI